MCQDLTLSWWSLCLWVLSPLLLSTKARSHGPFKSETFENKIRELAWTDFPLWALMEAALLWNTSKTGSVMCSARWPYWLMLTLGLFPKYPPPLQVPWSGCPGEPCKDTHWAPSCTLRVCRPEPGCPAPSCLLRALGVESHPACSHKQGHPVGIVCFLHRCIIRELGATVTGCLTVEQRKAPAIADPRVTHLTLSGIHTSYFVWVEINHW